MLLITYHMAHREALLALVRDFNAGDISADHLKKESVNLIKQKVYCSMSENEWQRFERLFRGWIDRYNAKYQPRNGVIGKLRDICDQVFHGNYYISLDRLRAKTREFEKSVS